MTIGERIRQRRLELKLTQQELADKLGYKDRSAVCQVERDKNNSITTDRIQAFANALDTTPAFLMGWESVSNAIQTVADGVGKSVENISDGIKKSFVISSDDELIVSLDIQESVGAEDKRLLRLLMYHFLLLSQDNREKLIERCEELMKLQGIEQEDA